MGHRKLDKIMFRMGIVFTVIAVICLIIVPKPSAEFTISIFSFLIAAAVTAVAAVRIRTDRDK